MSDAETTPEEAPVTLRCLRGAAAPPNMGRDLRGLSDLPKAAREDFWIALRAYLRPELDDEAERAITGYCEKHGLTPPDIAAPIKATRHLFREGAANGASQEDLAADVVTLLDVEEAQDLMAPLLSWYEDFLPALRHRMMQEAITDHGKLVIDTRWRLERITHSDRARGIDAPIGVVTFSYVEGQQERRCTLHFLPDQLAALRDAATEMLS